MKKAQFEAIGLSIIVVVIAIALLISFQLMVGKSPSKIQQDYSSKEISSSLLNALLRTTSQCNGLSIGELFLKVAGGEADNTCESHESMGIFLNTSLDYILSNTLDIWGRDYMLEAAKDGSVFYSNEKGDCIRRTTSKAAISDKDSQIEISLSICGPA